MSDISYTVYWFGILGSQPLLSRVPGIGLQTWDQSNCPELSDHGLVPLRCVCAREPKRTGEARTAHFPCFPLQVLKVAFYSYFFLGLSSRTVYPLAKQEKLLNFYKITYLSPPLVSLSAY